jgi:hypothetical protein
MIVKAAPLFATILCRWLGRLAMPIGVAADSAGGGAILNAQEEITERECV